MNEVTKQMIEDEMKSELNSLKNINPVDDVESYCKIIGNISRLAERLTEDDKVDVQYADSSERREVERERNRIMAETETAKNKLDPKRFVIDLLRFAAVPIGLAVFNNKMWLKAMGTTMEFETTGHLTSTASKMLGLTNMVSNRTPRN